jgi:hypothetical protein
MQLRRQRNAQLTYSVNLDDDAPRGRWQILSNGARHGRSYVAHKATVKAWVDWTYGAQQAAGMPRTWAAAASA